MKVQALRKVYYGQTILLGNKEVEFGKDGVADVSKEHGEMILAKYPTMVGTVGVKPIEKVQPQSQDLKNDRVYQELNERMENTQLQMENLKKAHAEEVAELTGQVENWKAEWEKTQDGGMVMVTKAIESLSMLQKLKVDELKSTAKEMLFPEAEYTNMKQPELILYLFTKILEAK